MRGIITFVCAVCIGLLSVSFLSACNSSPITPTQEASQDQITVQPPTPTLPIDEEAAFPLAEPGPYHVGIKRMITFSDANRNGREVSLTIWYPAQNPGESSSPAATPDAPADSTGAPYPLILCSSKVGFIFANTLASYGFVVVGVNGIDTYNPWDKNLVDQPLDILFALDQVSKQSIEGLEDIIDSDHTGAMGYSFDGYNALALSGARVDPEAYLAGCDQFPLPDYWREAGYCFPKVHWDDFVSHAGEALTTSDDGLWQPMTDERIKAVMPMAPEGVALFGDRGLAAADRAMLIIDGTNDTTCDYQGESVYIYQHVSSNDKSLISFLGEDHMMVYVPETITRMKHFAVAFFGYQLQGRTDLEYYYSADYVDQQEGLAWGPYPAP